MGPKNEPKIEPKIEPKMWPKFKLKMEPKFELKMWPKNEAQNVIKIWHFLCQFLTQNLSSKWET